MISLLTYLSLSRYSIHHPVCNDPTAFLWSSLGITCWPTQLLLSPTGRPVAVAMGEGQAGLVDELVQGMVELYGGRGELTGSHLTDEENSNLKGCPQ